MSPMVFNLALEPLAITIRTNQDIQGIMVKNKMIKLGIYADDVICYLTNPEKLFNKLKQILVSFGLISGYKVNQEKMVLIRFHITENMKQRISKIMQCK